MRAGLILPANQVVSKVTFTLTWTFTIQTASNGLWRFIREWQHRNETKTKKKKVISSVTKKKKQKVWIKVWVSAHPFLLNYR